MSSGIDRIVADLDRKAGEAYAEEMKEDAMAIAGRVLDLMARYNQDIGISDTTPPQAVLLALTMIAGEVAMCFGFRVLLRAFEVDENGKDARDYMPDLDA